MQQPPLFSSLFSTQTFFHQNASLLINIRFWSISYYQKDYTENITRPRKVGIYQFLMLVSPALAFSTIDY